MDLKIYNPEKLADCIVTLAIALERAGGSPYTTKQLKSLTAFDLVNIISTNNIVFKYKEVKYDSNRSTKDSKEFRFISD